MIIIYESLGRPDDILAPIKIKPKKTEQSAIELKKIKMKEAEEYERERRKATDMMISLDIMCLNFKESDNTEIDPEQKFYTVLVTFNGRRVHETEGTVGGAVNGGGLFLRRPNNRCAGKYWRLLIVCYDCMYYQNFNRFMCMFTCSH
jgi:hypothetical protein